MVAKFLIMGLTTAGTAVMERTLMLLMMGQRNKEKDDGEAYLNCADFDVPKEELIKIGYEDGSLIGRKRILLHGSCR